MIILLFFKVVLQSMFAVNKQPRLLLHIMCFGFTIGMGWLYMGLYGKIVHVHQALSFT